MHEKRTLVLDHNDSAKRILEHKNGWIIVCRRILCDEAIKYIVYPLPISAIVSLLGINGQNHLIEALPG
jgi:hypothetical protein